jgi:hypothetical protein
LLKNIIASTPGYQNLTTAQLWSMIAQKHASEFSHIKPAVTAAFCIPPSEAGVCLQFQQKFYFLLRLCVY